MKVHGPILDGYDITENTGIGRLLYDVASKPTVIDFLETGTQIGGSSRMIGSAFKEGEGELHTIEAVRSRVEEAQFNLSGLPVKCHWMSTKNEEGLRGYYNRFRNQIKAANGAFELLVTSRHWDAVFLDSCNVSQYYEMQYIVENGLSKPRHFLMHEPDAKCPGYDEYLTGHGYELITQGTDNINGHNPLYVYYQLKEEDDD